MLITEKLLVVPQTTRVPRGWLLQGWGSKILDDTYYLQYSLIDYYWLMVHGSCLKARAARLMAHGQEKLALGPPAQALGPILSWP